MQRAQFFQFLFKIILIQNVNRTGNLLQTGNRQMRVQKVLHQRLVLTVVDGITIANFYTAPHLGEKHKTILVLFAFFSGKCGIDLF